MQITRRTILTLAGTTLAGTPHVFAQDDMVTEFQRGDPAIPRERVDFSLGRVATNVKATKADYLPKLSDFRAKLLEEASGFLNFNRSSNRGEIADMLEIFGLKFADSAGKPYAYCAAGIGYVAARVYARSSGKGMGFPQILQYLGEVDHYNFYPTPGVANMVTVAAVHGRWIPVQSVISKKVDVKPGWLVAFKWNKTDHHVGIVKEVKEDSLRTIEFNTSPEGVTGSQANGSAVAERNRKINQSVIGFINTDYQIAT